MSETLTTTNQTALRHIPDGLILTAVKVFGYRSCLMNECSNMIDSAV
jgi:hypothetical protein